MGGASLSSSYGNTISALKSIDTVFTVFNILLELESIESTVYNDFIKS